MIIRILVLWFLLVCVVRIEGVFSVKGKVIEGFEGCRERKNLFMYLFFLN